MDVTPGMLHDGGADTGPPIAIVSTSPDRTQEYLSAAPIGRYVIVQTAADIPAGVEWGGLVILDRKPLPEGLPTALADAFGISGGIGAAAPAA